MKLLYVANPMCAWCYEFRDEIASLSTTFSQLPLEIVVSRFRADRPAPVAQPHASVDDVAPKRSTDALDTRIFDLSAPDARSECSCKALIASRLMCPQSSSLGVFRWLQHAYFNNGVDLSSAQNSADMVAMALNQQGYQVTASQVLERLESAEVDELTRAEFERVERWGIRKFPVLVLSIAEVNYDIPAGADAHQIAQELNMIMERLDSTLQPLKPLPSV